MMVDSLRIMSKNKDSAYRYLPLIFYLVFVWSICLIRNNFMWIVGDDPNLLNQSILISKGKIPNIDFFSGYPSLSQELQGLLINILGSKPFVQHIYSSILASLIGIYLYSKFKRINGWLLFLFLFFGYTQAFLVNPTPNPGHLFQLFAIVVIFNLMSQSDSRARKFAVIGICLAITVMSKQYGVVFALSLAEYIFILRLKSEYRRLCLSILLLLNIFLAGIYYVSVRKDAISELQFNLSTLLLVLPILFLGLGLVGSNTKTIIDFRYSFLIPIFCIVTTLTCYVWIYSFRNPFPILQELFIYAPREINKNVVAIELSLSSILRALLAVFLLLILSRPDWFSIKTSVFMSRFFQLSLLSMLLLCFRFMGNLSGTPLIFFAFILLFALSRKLDSTERDVVRIMMFSIMPLFFVLIPYPNYSFHIFILILFFLYTIDNINRPRNERIESRYRNIPLVLASLVLITGFAIHENNWISTLPDYRFRGILIESETEGWNHSIEEASKAEGVKCTDVGCWYLRLATNPSASVMNTYELPIWIRK